MMIFFTAKNFLTIAVYSYRIIFKICLTCTFVVTRGRLEFILKQGIHALEPVGAKTEWFGAVRDKFKN